jgi:mannose-6-phosphate isomerase-like protein (cupin superfamily)
MNEIADGLEIVIFGGIVMAYIIRSHFSAEGIRFFTPDSYSQQLAFMKHPAGKHIPPHKHNRVVREVQYTNEALFLRKGSLRVDFYGNDQRYLESRVLRGGDVILLVDGGHGFQALEEIEMIEVKQGPYTGEQDKTRFTEADPETIIIFRK